jgi:Lar family restriction alleviation protein
MASKCVKKAWRTELPKAEGTFYIKDIPDAKPCPLCGCKDIGLLGCKPTNPAAAIEYRLICEDCGERTAYGRTPGEALELWNARKHTAEHDMLEKPLTAKTVDDEGIMRLAERIAESLLQEFKDMYIAELKATDISSRMSFRAQRIAAARRFKNHPLVEFTELDADAVLEPTKKRCRHEFEKLTIRREEFTS